MMDVLDESNKSTNQESNIGSSTQQDGVDIKIINNNNNMEPTIIKDVILKQQQGDVHDHDHDEEEEEEHITKGKKHHSAILMTTTTTTVVDVTLEEIDSQNHVNMGANIELKTTKSEINSVVVLTPPTTPAGQGNISLSDIDPPSPMISENLMGKLMNGAGATVNDINATESNLSRSIVGTATKDTNRSSGGIDAHKYKNYIKSRLQSSHVRDDPLAKDLINFPSDDLFLQKTTQNHRILLPNFNNEYLQELNVHVKNSIESFLAPRKLIIRNYSKFKKEDKPIFEQDKYECDVIQKEKENGNGSPTLLSTNSTNAGQSSSPKLSPQPLLKSQKSGLFGVGETDDLHFEYLKAYTEETDHENSEQRKKSRLGLFKYFKPDYNWGSGTEVSLCNRTAVDIWTKRTSTNVLVEFKGLGFLLGEHEPFFCSMFLYDHVNKIRLSETFHFDFNTQQLKSLIYMNGSNSEKSSEDETDQYTQSKHVVVSLPHVQDKDIWMIIKVNKIVQGNPEQAREPYMKLDEKETTKVKSKISGVIKDIGKRLGRYNQAFCVTAIQLTNENGTVKYATPERCDLYKAVPKNNNDLPELIENLKEPGKKKKMKTLLGTLTINIFKPENELPAFNQRLDPSYDFVKSSEPFNTGLSQPPPPLVSHPSIVINNGETPASIPPTPSSPTLQRNNTSISRVSSSIGTHSNQVIPVIREIQSFCNVPELTPHQHLVNNLYIYPNTVNLNKAHGRNICIKIEIRDNDNLSQPPLKYIYGKSSNLRFTNFYYTETHYHDKTPDFIDEIKVKLPVKFSSQLHILFSFYHVICKVKKGSDVPEELIGFSVLPLYRDESFVGNGLHQLPLCIGPPKDKYLSNSEEYQLLENGKNVFKLDLNLNSTLYPQNRYINNFLLKSPNENSSSEDLNNILNHFNLIDPLEGIKFFSVIMNQLLYLICNNNDPLHVGCYAVKALFVLLTKIQSYLEDNNLRVPLFVQYVSHVFDNIRDVKSPVYLALCTNFVYFLMRRRDPSNTLSSVSITSIFSFTWFINDLIIKSLSLLKLEGNPSLTNSPKLSSTNNLNNSTNSNTTTTPTNNNNEQEEEFIKYLQKIITFNIHLIQTSITSTQDGKLASEANNNLALFIRDLFAVYDRGAIIDLVFTYIHDINQAISKDPTTAQTLIFFKFDFLKIITDYEHYINLNIPIPFSISHIPTLSLKISDCHPISGIIQREVVDVLLSGTHTVEVRLAAFSTLNTLLTKHEYDSRYQDPQKKERISSIYFQMILDIIDNYDRFVHWSNNSDLNERRLFISCCLYVLKNMSKHLLKQWIQKEIPQRINIIFQVLEIFANTFEYQQVSNQSPRLPFVTQPSMIKISDLPLTSSDSHSNSPITPSTPSSSTLNLITASGKLSKDIFHQSKHKHKHDTLSPAKDILQRSSSSSGIKVDTSESSTAGTGPNSSSSTPPSLSSLPSSSSLGLSEHIQSEVQNRSKSASVSRVPPTTGSRVSANESVICSEANFIILDFVEMFIKTQYTALAKEDSPVMERLFLLLILLLKKRQSHRFVHSLFATLRSFVVKFKNHFFKVNNNNFCGIICYEVLRYCNFPTKEIRALGTALLYGMIRINSQEVGNFGRMKIQATIALSNLAKSGVFGNDFKRLERSFRAISDYSSKEARAPTTQELATEGNSDELTQSIGSSASELPLLPTSTIDNASAAATAATSTAAVHISSSSFIPFDILAKNDHSENQKYRDNFTQQIQKMSSKLSKIIRDTVRANILKTNSDPETIHELYSEIAAGYSDTPIIRIDWLNLLADTLLLEEQYFEAAICKTRIALLVINYLEQHNLLPCKLDLSLIEAFCPGLKEIVVEEDEGVCTNPIFSISGLTSSIYLAINQLRLGDFFEYSILLYKLLVPLYEKLRDFSSLSNCHKQIHKLYKEIIRANEGKSRMLGRYYRVGFYGEKFEDLNGKEFVYKEPKLTHLFALSERLKTFYLKKFGEPVTVFPDSGKIDLDSLDPTKHFLQITSLKPYFEPSELESRPDYFEKHTLLNRFVFITPFTLTASNKIQSNQITEQWTRKTILSIENTAPNMLKRYQVIGRGEIEISPIENSIDTIEIRNNLLSLEISQSPPNIKTLQGVLQGSVLLQVNAGAIEICKGFLITCNRKNWPTHLVDKLIASCKKFLKLCEQALSINRNNMLTVDPFHQELEAGYKKLYAKMVRYIKGDIHNEEDVQKMDQEFIQLEQQQQQQLLQQSNHIDDDSIATDFSYDERTEDSSIKEQQSILDQLTPSFLLKEKEKTKKSSSFLAPKEDKKRNRSSSEFTK